jgi:hypothetical protein
MIGCAFIQTNELMLKGQEFICTSKMIYIINVEFKHSNCSFNFSSLFLVLLRDKKNYWFLVGEDEGKYH